MVDRARFELATFRLSAPNWASFAKWLENKGFTKHYQGVTLHYAQKYNKCLLENNFEILIGAKCQRSKLCALANLAKYLNKHTLFKEQMKNAGLKWSNGDLAFKGFLSIISHSHNTVPQYIEKTWPHLEDNEKVFIKFLAITGLRINEAATAFNQIINFNKNGELNEYYNESLACLEHFKHRNLFLRGTKNAFISFIHPDFIKEITMCSNVNYNRIQCRFKRLGFNLRFKELRSYNNTYLRQNGILAELVDLTAGRIPKSVFVRHYLGVDMNTLSRQILSLQGDLWQKLHQ